VRRFAQFWSASDPRTEVPPLGLLPHRYARKPPYIYTEDDIRRLIAVARQLPSATGLRPASYATLLGLLAVTGLRISEALALNRADVDGAEAVLTIRRTKFGKSRLVPVHPATQRALGRYARRRDRVPYAHDREFLRRARRSTDAMHGALYLPTGCRDRSAFRGPADGPGPRLHDFGTAWP
jgi:integrase